MNKNSDQKSNFGPFGYAYLKIVTDEIGEMADHIILDCNTAFEKIIGIGAEKLINSRCSEILSHIGSYKIDFCKLHDSSGDPIPNSYLEFFSDQQKRWYKAEAYKSEQGYCTLYLLDIHEQKIIKEELHELALVASKTTDVVIITDNFGKISWVNDAFEKLTEYTLEEVKGKKPGSFLQGKDTDFNTRKLLREAIRNNQPVRVEILNYTKSCREYWLDLKIDPIIQADGTVGKFIAITREITERKNAESALNLALVKQKVLNELFDASTQIKNLDDFLQKTVDILLNIPFLNILPSIGIFTLANDQTLLLRAYKNFSSEILKTCQLVPFGKCHCGQAALTHKPIYSGCIDAKHEIIYTGIAEHGHYNIPIVAQDQTLGVIVVYLPEKHPKEQNEIDFLCSVADILAAKITNINTEESLVKNELKYRAIFENVQDVFYQTDMAGLVIEISPSIKRYSGYEVDEILGKQIGNFYYYPEDRIKLLETLMTKKEVVDFQVRLRSKDEKLVYTSVNCHLLYDSENKVIGVEGSLRDITERVKADEIRKIQFKIATAITATNDLNEFIELIRVELNKYVDTFNFFVALYNEKKDTLSSHYFKDEFEDADEWPAEKSLTGMVVHENRSILLHETDIDELVQIGKIERLGPKSACWLGIPLRSEGKAIGAFVVQSYTDPNAYTESNMEFLEFVSNQISIAFLRKKDEEEIALLSKSISQSPVSVVITDTSGRIEYVNPKFTQVTGYTYDEAIGQNPSVLKSGKQPPETYSDLWTTISSGYQWTGEFHNKKKNGELFWEFASISPIVDSSGKVNHYVAVKEDITERKKAEEQMRDLANRLTTLIANLPGGILLETPRRKIQQTNQKFCELFGINALPEALVGYDYIEASEAVKHLFMHAETFNSRVDEILERKKPVLNEELQLVDGRFFQRDFVPILNAEKEYEYLWHYRDITHQKTVEKALQKQALLQKILMDISSKYINMPVAQIETEIMASLKELAQFVEADRAYIVDYNWENNTCINTHEWCAEGISPTIEDLQDFPLDKMKHWVEAHKKGLPVNIPDTDRIPSNDKLQPILISHNIKSLIAIPMMVNNQCIGFVGFDSVNALHNYSETEEILLSVFSEMLVNIRHRATLEKILIEEKKKADYANKAKSEFLANMSHEIRTPLNGVIGFTDLLLKTPLNKIQSQYAENVNISGISLLGIINDILDFSKIEAGKMELDLIKTDIIELMEQSSDIIKYHASKKGLELLLNIQPDIPRFAEVDPIRLKQILVNLLSNAVKFTETGEVELRVNFTPKDNHIGLFSFSVRDTGIGINEEQQKKLFKAFSQADTSTTRKFGGTGLGLTISNMLAEKMGGKIRITSEPGKGSIFFFTLEIEFEEGEKLDTNSQLEIKRALVIDDNDNNRLILEHTFKNWGIEFTGIDSGLTAIQLIAKSKPFDVAIIDYHMPYMNGIDTIKLIREKLELSATELPIILLHSSSDDIEIYEECKKLDVRFNLTKPIKSQELFHYLKNINNPLHQPIEHSKTKVNGKVRYKTLGQSKPVILVAEDVAINMVLITTLIRQIIPNAEIIEAKNGKIALDLMISNKPALVFMDVQMPEMDGIASTREIRRHESKSDSHIPIIALTAGAVKGEEDKCRDAGMDDFLTKPIVQDDVFGILKKYLSLTVDDSYIQSEEPEYSPPQLHFDEKMMIKNFGNDKELWKALIGSVLTEFPEYIQSLQQAIQHRKVVQIQIVSHSIKGASLNMCFNQMVELAREMEANPEAETEVLQELFDRISFEWEIIKAILENR